MPEPDHRLLPVPSAQLALAANHLALLNKILPPAVHGPVPGRPWEIAHLGLKLVWIEPGTFLMGYEDNDEIDYGSDMRPLTKVTLTQAFWLGQTSVTQGQYETVMKTNPSHFKDAGKDAPVERVSWDDAMTFCKKLTVQERAAGRLLTEWEFTLPTEAQWEYACRAGSTGDYAGDLDLMAWYSKNSGKTTHPVGTKQPNAWGLYDMHGNVRDWCLGWYGRYPGGNITDPGGRPSGSRRIKRGSCWFDSGWGCRSALRGKVSVSDFRNKSTGFRLALNSVR
ncbi:MAG: formylglycine-generating enzyme family protein [Alphaproteobacteria bacterium]